jgi:hypothetical protein
MRQSQYDNLKLNDEVIYCPNLKAWKAKVTKIVPVKQDNLVFPLIHISYNEFTDIPVYDANHLYFDNGLFFLENYYE